MSNMPTREWPIFPTPLIKKVHQDKGLHFSPKKNVLTNIDASSKRQLLQFYLFPIVLDFISGSFSPLKD